MAEFIKANAKADLTAGHGVMVELQGKKIAIFNVDETFYAVDDTCTHVGGPLSEGELEGTMGYVPVARSYVRCQDRRCPRSTRFRWRT